MACSFIKRQAKGDCWDDVAGEVTVKLIKDTLAMVECEDPVKRSMHVTGWEKGVVWCDASNLVLPGST